MPLFSSLCYATEEDALGEFCEQTLPKIPILNVYAVCREGAVGLIPLNFVCIHMSL